MGIALLRILPDKFIVGLILMIVLAYWFPQVGIGATPINLELIIDIGIAFIFFFYGLKLSPEKFRIGLRNWKLHLLIQAITFLIFPLLVIPFYPIFSDGPYALLWLAVFFMAALPSTISSSVVMVSIARGNIPGAIFNASISGVIGIFFTPLWMSLFLGENSETFAFADILLELLLQILLPVVLGLLLNRFLASIIERFIKQVSAFDKIIILLIVYKSFSKSFEAGFLDDIGMQPLMALSACVILLFFLIMFVSKLSAEYLGFSREDTITTVFCGTKKSLVHGSVMHNVLFSQMAAGGIILLPIMIYHAFQLFYISFLAGKIRREE